MTPALFDDLMADEGLRLRAYPDPLSGAEPWTIGYGHTGPEVHPALTWTEGQAIQALHVDVGRAVVALDAHLPWWRGLGDVRQDCLVELCFNMGVGFPPEAGRPGRGLRAFVQALEDLRAGRYAEAAEHLLASRWAHEVGRRAGRLAHMIRDGVRPARCVSAD